MRQRSRVGFFMGVVTQRNLRGGVVFFFGEEGRDGDKSSPQTFADTQNIRLDAERLVSKPLAAAPMPLGMSSMIKSTLCLSQISRTRCQ